MPRIFQWATPESPGLPPDAWQAHDFGPVHVLATDSTDSAFTVAPFGRDMGALDLTPGWWLIAVAGKSTAPTPGTCPVLYDLAAAPPEEIGVGMNDLLATFGLGHGGTASARWDVGGGLTMLPNWGQASIVPFVEGHDVHVITHAGDAVPSDVTATVFARPVASF